jgi:hypothetical protein
LEYSCGQAGNFCGIFLHPVYQDLVYFDYSAAFHSNYSCGVRGSCNFRAISLNYVMPRLWILEYLDIFSVMTLIFHILISRFYCISKIVEPKASASLWPIHGIGSVCWERMPDSAIQLPAFTSPMIEKNFHWVGIGGDIGCRECFSPIPH